MTREEAAMCKEIARELRQQLPEQVNLADLMGAEAFMGSMWGWDDPAPYVMDRAACWLEALANSNPQLDSNGLMPCGCEWCMAEKRIMEHHGLSFNAYCVIFDGKLDVSYDNNDINEWVCGHKEVKINYCPMCGRKLEGRQ